MYAMQREESDGSLFQPDILIAAEFFEVFRAKRFHDPESRLMAAVLEEAIHCFLKHLSSQSRRGRRLYGEVESWFFGEDDGWLFSFESICENLGVSAGYIRRGLLKARAAAQSAAAAVAPARAVQGSRSRAPGPAKAPRGALKSRRRFSAGRYRLTGTESGRRR
jgi:hypothetical protein